MAYLLEIKTSDRTLKLTLSDEIRVTSPSVQSGCFVRLESSMAAGRVSE